jgi:hypothetical protein
MSGESSAREADVGGVLLADRIIQIFFRCHLAKLDYRGEASHTHFVPAGVAMPAGTVVQPASTVLVRLWGGVVNAASPSRTFCGPVAVTLDLV